jgi:hypothetical protein
MNRKIHRSSQFTHEDDYNLTFPTTLTDAFMCMTLQKMSMRYLLDVTRHGDAARLNITADVNGFRTDNGKVMSIGWCEIDLITDWHIQNEFEEGEWQPWKPFKELPSGYFGLLDPLHSPNRGVNDDVTSIGAIVLSDRAIERIASQIQARQNSEIKITGQLSDADLVAVTILNLTN